MRKEKVVSCRHWMPETVERGQEHKPVVEYSLPLLLGGRSSSVGPVPERAQRVHGLIEKRGKGELIFGERMRAEERHIYFPCEKRLSKLFLDGGVLHKLARCTGGDAAVKGVGLSQKVFIVFPKKQLARGDKKGGIKIEYLSSWSVNLCSAILGAEKAERRCFSRVA